jgi:hypothetical protein
MKHFNDFPEVKKLAVQRPPIFLFLSIYSNRHWSFTYSFSPLGEPSERPVLIDPSKNTFRKIKLPPYLSDIPYSFNP